MAASIRQRKISAEGSISSGGTAFSFDAVTLNGSLIVVTIAIGVAQGAPMTVADAAGNGSYSALAYNGGGGAVQVQQSTKVAAVPVTTITVTVTTTATGRVCLYEIINSGGTPTVEEPVVNGSGTSHVCTTVPVTGPGVALACMALGGTRTPTYSAGWTQDSPEATAAYLAESKEGGLSADQAAYSVSVATNSWGAVVLYADAPDTDLRVALAEPVIGTSFF